MIIWRSHIKIVGSPGRSRIDLCLNKSVLAMGWSLNDRHLEEHNFSEDEKRKINQILKLNEMKDEQEKKKKLRKCN